jgi:hypothetical protein
MKSTKLKGGSLSATWLCESRNLKFVRKSVKLNENREYGFMRWYSQLKKMQRLYTAHPKLLPKILKVAYQDDTAYFDMEYLEGFTDVKSLLRDDSLSPTQLHQMHDALWRAFDTIHAREMVPLPSSMRLYYKEEVKQKLDDAMLNKEFAEFANMQSFYYMGQEVFNISNYLELLNGFLNLSLIATEETIHGNPTLENVMYSPYENRVVFIDLYEESIIDSKLLDYAQVLQCSSSRYGIINDGDVFIDGDNQDHLYLDHNSKISDSLLIFNTYFVGELHRRNVDMKLVRALEATQFIRMLPFKILAGDIDKAKFFYVHACKLLGDIFDVE